MYLRSAGTMLRSSASSPSTSSSAAVEAAVDCFFVSGGFALVATACGSCVGFDFVPIDVGIGIATPLLMRCSCSLKGCLTTRTAVSSPLVTAMASAVLRCVAGVCRRVISSPL